MVAEHRHRFRTIPPDYSSSNPRAWRLSVPRTGSRDTLLVELDEPLDRALLERLIEVRRNGQHLSGRVEVSDRETVWTFRPDHPWSFAPHQLSVDVRLEDRAGNRIDRPFERDLEHGPGASSDGPSQILLEFGVAPR